MLHKYEFIAIVFLVSFTPSMFWKSSNILQYLFLKTVSTFKCHFTRHAFRSPEKNIQCFLVYKLGDHYFFIKSQMQRQFFTLYSLCTLFQFYSLSHTIYFCRHHFSLIFCRGHWQWQLITSGMDLYVHVWKSANLLQISVKSPLHTEVSDMTILVMKCWLGLKALVFFPFDWYFTMLQPEYISSEPEIVFLQHPKHTKYCVRKVDPQWTDVIPFFNLCGASK